MSVTVALNALLMGLGLGLAVFIGASFAVLLVVRANMRDVVRRVWTGVDRHSLKMRTPAAAETLRREGRRIAVLELEGSLFFGTADALRLRLEALGAEVNTAILDLHQVKEVDATAARILFETAEDWARAGWPRLHPASPSARWPCWYTAGVLPRPVPKQTPRRCACRPRPLTG